MVPHQLRGAAWGRDHLDLGVEEGESAGRATTGRLERELEELVSAGGGQARRGRERLREGQRVGALLSQPRVLDRHLRERERGERHGLCVRA